MRHALYGPGVCFLFVALIACSSTSKKAETQAGSVDGRRTSVSVLARELHLSPGYDARRNRVVLSGVPGRVVLYPGTSVALVNGVRLTGMSRVVRSGSDFTLERSDAARIGAALAVHPAAAPAHRTRYPAPEPALTPATGTLRTATGDPAWDVKITRRWRFIVIHHSATTAGSAASFHRAHLQKGWDGLGYHFVIGNGRGSPDGLVETGYRWSRQRTGAHAGHPRHDVNLLNEQGIGICLVGNFEDQRPSAKQKQALHRLIAWLRKRCDIPANHVFVHRDVAVKGTKCPGANFPVREFLTPHRDVPKLYR